MPRRNASAPAGRRKPLPSTRNQQQQRQRIAQLAAEIILDHGIDDWQYAKRKAARQLLLPENNMLPDNDEVETALFERQALFGAFQEKPHDETLCEKRRQALVWMTRLEDFSPRLYGALAEGWGGENQAIRIELVSDDFKAVEIQLINLGFPYQNAATHEGSLQLAVHENSDQRDPVLLRVISPQMRRNRKERRLFLDQQTLAALLETRENAD